jgi:hypothetical protein
MSAAYWEEIDLARGVWMWVDFETRRDDVVDYVVILARWVAGRMETVRIYDAAHGFNEMHRFTRSFGKQDGIEIHRGTLGEGMRSAKDEIKQSYLSMIEGWER